MNIEKNVNGIPGLHIITPQVYYDNRGYFMESFNKVQLEKVGIYFDSIQDNHSKSIKNVLRGMHYQLHHPQTKIIRVISGAIFDVIVDLRKDSPTYKQWFGIQLNKYNKIQLFIPKGCAHGFLTLSEYAEVCYKCDEAYHPQYQSGIRWNDPSINIQWPITSKQDLIINERDMSWRLLA